MPQTSVPAVRDALLAALSECSDLDGVLIQRGLPTEIPAESDKIYFLRVQNGDRTRLVQQGGAAETYDMRLLIEVADRENGTWEATNDRAWEIFNLIEATVTADPELDGEATDSMVDTFEEEAPLALVDGWLSRITVSISYEAQI